MSIPVTPVRIADAGQRPMERCQQQLVLIWLGLLAPSAILLALQSMSTNSPWGAQIRQPWSWYLPLVIPLLTLMIGAVVRQATGQPTKPRYVPAFVFNLTAGLSAAYLLTVLAVIIAAAGNGADGAPLRMLTNASLFLAPFQGLVGLALGAFFVSAESPNAS